MSISAEELEQRWENQLGLSPEQQAQAERFGFEATNFLLTLATEAGVRYRTQPGREISKLVNAGFVALEANGSGGTARLTLAGYRGLLLRMKRGHPRQARGTTSPANEDD